MRTLTISSIALMLLCLSVAAVQAENPKRNALSDRDFVNEAAVGGTLEVRLGELAQVRATDVKVRKFGEKMATDHSAANKQLLELLKKKGMEPPPKTLPKKMQDHYDRLAKLRGAEFDKAYIKDMVDDHREDVALFETIVKTGRDADLKAFALKTLPTIREHYHMARELAGLPAEDK